MHLFGSMARGTNKPDSDVDIFVDMEPDIHKMVILKEYLENLLGMAVDLVRKHRSLSKFFLNQIKKDGICII